MNRAQKWPFAICKNRDTSASPTWEGTRSEALPSAVFGATRTSTAETILNTDGTAENAYTLAFDALKTDDHPDAFVCNDNLAAFGLLKACKELHLSVPQEIGIVAFDNYPLAEYMDPPLTIVDIDTAMLGEQSVQLLFRRIENKVGNQQIILSTNLVVRASSERKAK